MELTELGKSERGQACINSGDVKFKPPYHRGVFVPYILFMNTSETDPMRDETEKDHLVCLRLGNSTMQPDKLRYYVRGKGYKILGFELPKSVSDDGDKFATNSRANLYNDFLALLKEMVAYQDGSVSDEELQKLRRAAANEKELAERVRQLESGLANGATKAKARDGKAERGVQAAP